MAALVLFVWIGLLPTTSGGQIQWTNTTGGNWSNPSNWNPGKIPEAGDDVFITVSGTYTVETDSHISIRSLTLGGSSGVQTLSHNGYSLTLQNPGVANGNSTFAMAGGLLSGPGDMTFQGKVIWSGGGFEGDGTVVFAAGSQVQIQGDSDKYLSQKNLNNFGTMTWSGQGSLFGEKGSVWSNRSGALFEVLNSRDFYYLGNGAFPTFNNAGILRKKTDAGSTLFTIPFNNSGTVELQSGSLRFISEGSHPGAFIGSVGTSFEFAGATNDFSGTLNSAGTTLIESATVRFLPGAKILAPGQNFQIVGEGSAGFNSGSAVHFANLTVEGLLEGNDILNVSGNMTWRRGGTLKGPGVINANGPLNINTTESSVLLDGRVLNIAGGAVWTGNYNGFYLNEGSVVNNLAGSTFSMEGGDFISQLNVVPGVFNNAGVLRKVSGPGKFIIYQPLNSSGTVQVQSGELSLAGGGVYTGPILGEPGATLEFGGGSNVVNGVYQVAGTTLVTNYSTVDFKSGAQILNLGQKLEIHIGNANFLTGGQITVSNFSILYGTLGGTDPLKINGTMHWLRNSSLMGSGLLDARGPLTINPEESAIVLDGRSLHINNGAIWMGSTNVIYLGQGAVISNLAASVFLIQGDSSILDYGGEPGTIGNAGVFRKTEGSGVTEFFSQFSNSGSVELLKGSMVFGGNGNSSGSITGAAGTLFKFRGNTMNITGSFLNSGHTLIAEGGLASFNGLTILAGLEVSGGLLGGTGKVSVAGSASLKNYGNFVGGGSVDLNAPLSIDTSMQSVILDGKRLNIKSGATWSGTNGFYVINGAQIHNFSNSIFTIVSDDNLYSYGEIESLLVNDGLLEKAGGAGQTAIGTALINNGEIKLKIGALLLAGDTTLNGSVNSAAGTKFEFGGVTNHVNGIFGVQGAMSVRYGVSVVFHPTATVSNIVETDVRGALVFNTGDSQTFSNLTLSGGFLGGTDSIRVNGSMNWLSSGTVAGAGAINLFGKLLIDTTNYSVVLDEKVLNVFAGATWAGSSNVLYLRNGAVISNASASVFTIIGDSFMGQIGEIPGKFFNSGTLRKTGGTGSTAIYQPFFNSGTVDVRSGILDFGTDGIFTGNLVSAPASKVTFSGGSNYFSAPYQADGPTVISGALVVFDGPANFHGLDLIGGVLGGKGLVTVSGPLRWSGNARFLGSGFIHANGPLTIDTTGGAVVLEGRTLNISGGAVWIGKAGGLYLAGGANINNLAGSEFQIQGDDFVGIYSEPAGAFNNAGLFRKVSGNAATTVHSRFNNTGTVRVSSGRLSFAGGGSFAGSMLGDVGKILEFGGGTNDINGVFNNAGSTTIKTYGVANFNPSAQVVSFGTSLEIFQGHAVFQSGKLLAITNLSLREGTLGGTDSLEVMGSMLWGRYASLTGAGTIHVQGPLTIAPEESSLALSGRQLNIGAGATWLGGTNIIYVGEGGTISNLVNSTFLIEGDSVMAQFSEKRSSFFNAGLFKKLGGPGASSLHINFVNSGSVELLQGVLELYGETVSPGGFSGVAGTEFRFRGSKALLNGPFQTQGKTTIDQGGNADFNGGTILNSLEINTGNVGGSGAVAVAGRMYWGNYSTLSGSGVLNANGLLTMDSTNGGVVLNRKTIQINNGANWGGSNGVYFVDGAQVYNRSNSTFQILNDDSIYQHGETNSAFHNAGILRKTGTTGLTQIQPQLFNNGKLELRNGSLSLYGGRHDGSVIASAGTTLEFSSGTNDLNGIVQITDNVRVLRGSRLEINPSTTILSAGKSWTVSGYANFNHGAPQIIPFLNMEGGVLGGADPITITSNMLLGTFSILTGSGGMDVRGSLLIDPAVNSVFLDGQVLNIHAGATWAGSSNGIYLANGASINNRPGSTFLITGDSFMGQIDTNATSFRNAGTLRKTGADYATTIYVPFFNSGVVEVRRGILELVGDGSNSGNFSGTTNSEIHFLGGTVAVNGSYKSDGPTKILGATVNFNSAAQFSSLELNAGTLGGTGAVTVTGPMKWARYGNISGSGLLSAQGLLTIDTTDGAVFLDQKTLDIRADAVWIGSANGLYLANDAILRNRAGSLFLIKGDDILAGNGEVHGRFENFGTIRKDGGLGITLVYQELTSSGPIDVRTGTLSIGGGGKQTGPLSATAGAMVAFSGNPFDVAGTYSVVAETMVTNYGTVNFTATAQILGLGQKFSINPGNARFFTGDPVALTNLTLRNGTLGGSDPVTVFGSMSWGDYGRMEGSGVVDARTPVELKTLEADVVIDGKEVRIHSGINWSGERRAIYVGNAAVLQNEPASTFTIFNDGVVSTFGETNGLLINKGLILKLGGTNETALYIPFVNSGTVDIQKSAVGLYGGVELLPTSVLSIPIGGYAPGRDFGQIRGGYNVHLGGSLSLRMTNGFRPLPLDTFRIMTWEGQRGGFIGETGLELGGALFFQAICDVNGMSLVTRSFDASAPAPRTNLVDQVVAIGDSATFSFAPSGLEPLRFQWLFNGLELPGETGTALILNQAQTTNAGVYCARVVDALNITNLYCALLSTIRPPVLTNQPVSLNLTNANEALLRVAASGDGPFKYQWRLNGANIPGATGAVYRIEFPQPRDGGSYDVVVANAARAVASTGAVLRVDAPLLPFADHFGARGRTNGLSGAGLGSNLNATHEPAEGRLHAGKFGTNSVWLEWTAPTNGVATFNTRGSSFDTLLDIYRGTNLNNLVLLASDDDRGGFFTSDASFNVQAGVSYVIAIDGFSGSRGDIVLNWHLETYITEIPRFVDEPVNVTSVIGGSATFTALASSTFEVSYQWYQNCCLAIPGATNKTLTITNIGPLDVGFYRVEATTPQGETAQSVDATLEIGSLADARSFDKLEDLLSFQDGAGGGLKPLVLRSSGGAGAFPSVTIGSIGSQIINNFNSTTERGEPIHSDVIGGASRWFQISSRTNGMLTVDTIGSDIDTVLAVYTGNDFFSLKLVAKNNNGAPDGLRSRVSFNATGGTRYLIAVDGVNGAQGNINLNWRLEKPAQTGGLPVYTFVTEGSAVAFSAGESPGTARYQWRLNGGNLRNQTNKVLNLTSVEFSQHGIYSVIVRAGVSSVTNQVANLLVHIPLRVELDSSTGGFEVRVIGSGTNAVILDLSTNLVNWRAVFTNQNPDVSINFSDTAANQRRQGFYRLRPRP